MTKPKKGSKDLITVDPSASHSPGPPGGGSLPLHLAYAIPDLTPTGMDNVLEKLRAGEALTAKERDMHDKGLVSVLKQIHDDLDETVLEACGWAIRSHDIPVVPRSEMSKEENETANSSTALAPLRQECRNSIADILARGDSPG
jgi:hypothetical protein